MRGKKPGKGAEKTKKKRRKRGGTGRWVREGTEGTEGEGTEDTKGEGTQQGEATPKEGPPPKPTPQVPRAGLSLLTAAPWPGTALSPLKHPLKTPQTPPKPPKTQP